MTQSGKPRTLYGRRSTKAVVSFTLLLLLCFPAFALQAGQQAKFKLEGRIVDSTGAPVAGAQIVQLAGSTRIEQTTNSEGRFSFGDVAPGRYELQVLAKGFKESAREVNLQQAANLEIVLEPDSFTEEMTVTAERTLARVSDTAASVAVLSKEDLSTTAAVTLDDALRQVPGFSLFRRSGSRTSNPTSQGVSLRGVGASGASRAVVLDDGIPINDPFGGWIYWGRTPRESISRVEVVRGGASSLYGTDALGGVINFIPRDTSDAAFSLETSYGNEQTPDASLFAGGRFGKYGAQVAAQAFHTDGYILVSERGRGRVDTKAGGEFTSLAATLERFIGDAGRIFVRGSIFGESRENGTPLQTNRTHIRQLAFGSDFKSQEAGAFSLRVYGGTQVFDQGFTAVAANRNSENLTRSQRTPAQQFGIASQWSRAAGSRQTLVAGFDFRNVRGASDEIVFTAGRATSAIGAGGRERAFGIFGQDIIRATDRFFITIGGRYDKWRNYDALSATTVFATRARSATFFTPRDESAFSPRLTLLYKVNEHLALTASGYRAFRAPTLNELYRSFRVGNVFTQANDQLRAERLTGGEAGASLNGFKQRLNLRGTFFWSEITRPVANVTRSVTPDLITRQRQNLGRTRSRGVELEAETRLTSQMVLTGGYLFADATVLRFPANVALEGLLLPQVPRHQFTFQWRYVNPSIVTVGVQGRAVSSQFDDDQNQLELGKFFTLDLLASRRLTHNLEVFGAFENLFDERYAIGRTNVTTIGPPRLGRIGFRLNFGAR